MRRWRFALLALALLCCAAAARGADEDDFYRIVTLPTPEGTMLEPGGIEIMPDGRVAACTRWGEVWIADGVFDEPPENIRYTRFAEGLHECLGLARRGEWLYVTQRCEVTRLRDVDGDDRADVFETVADGWGLSGDYHEYAFGSRFDREGRIWVVLCLTGSFSSDRLFRGWALTVSHDGVLTPVASGIRSPGGVGHNLDGDAFYTDNQGPWNGTCSLRHIKPGTFMGHPGSFRWYSDAPNMGDAPEVPRSGSRIHVESERVPELVPPAVLFPYGAMGQSASAIAADASAGRFGPFAGQLFVGDQTHSTVMRVFLERVRGEYQGACFPFREGFKAGIISALQAPDGSLLVGGSGRGWGSRGGRQYSFERVVWTGRTPFEVAEMRVRRDGFELAFTAPLDAETATRVDSYAMRTFTYIYQSSYGSPEVDHTTPEIEHAEVSGDRRSVRLVVRGLRIGHIHELRLPGVRSTDGEPLLHPIGYYTLFRLPAAGE